MISVTTIKDYIDKCDDLLLIATNDTAKPLVKEILAVLRSDLQGLAQGLSVNSADVLSQVDYIGDLKLLHAKLQKEYDARISYSENITQNKEKKLFISHATYDKDYVGAIINLFESLGFREDEIICSSIPPYCVPLDNNVYSWLVNKFQNYDLHVIYTLSKTYYSRPACLNEMGAAWAMQQKWSAILLPDFDFSEIDGCIDPRHISIKLDDLDRDNLNFRLGELKDNLINEFGLRNVSSTYWERKRNEFLKQIEEIKKTRLEEDSSKDVETYNSTNISLRNDEIVLLVYAAADRNGQIIASKSITRSTPVIITHEYEFNPDDSPEIGAYWKSVLKNLEKCNLIETDYKRELFYVTDYGYTFAKMLKEKMNIDTDKSPEEYLD